jgi:predicted phage terminase large subunit-like protein
VTTASVSLSDIPKILHKLPLHEQERLLAELEKLAELKRRKAAQDRFLPFVKEVWPTFIAGRHHAKMANAFERVANGELKRLIVCMPPRHTKSEFASYLLPAWFLGKYPHKKVIQCSHTAELAVGFGRKVRNLVDTEAYKGIFPDLQLAADSKAAGRWNTSKGGDYFAIGSGGAVTGKGADCAYFSCRVLTKRGIQRIADVRVGDFVYGYDHKKQETRWARVLAGSTQRKPELVNVGGFVCTPEHRVFTSAGYVRADSTDSVAVCNMSDMVLAETRRVFPRSATAGEDASRSEGILFSSVQPYNYAPEGVHLREQESTTCCNVQSMLPAWENCESGVYGVLNTLRAQGVRTRKEPRAPRGHREHLLLETLLREAQEEPTAPYSCNDWQMPYLRFFRHRGSEVLLYDVLHQSEGPEYGVFGEMVLSEACSEEARRWYVRSMRAGEAAGSRAPYKPHSRRQSYGELYNSMRTMPHPISYTDRGTCAAAYADVLPGEGHWVVDIQTDTENFFVWGPDSDVADTLPVLAHNCLIIDDIHSEQEASIAEINPDIYDKAYEWFTSGPRQRLQPGGAIVIVMTRWSKRDLVGRILQDAATNDSIGEWEVIEFPAVLPSGKPLWPEFWELDELLKVKRDVPNSKWQAQYQQNPVSESAAIVKREWWQEWPEEYPPQCDFILQSWDTAFEKSQRADYSACTTWGIFYHPDENGTTQANIILLNAFRDRMEFPELKKVALEEYREWQPDGVIIEKKASGSPLLYELRAMGIPVQGFTPTRGNDKISRLNAVADIFASGRVWAPATRWAEEVIDEVGEFPAGSHDDYVDTVSMALHRFRQGGYVGTVLDEPDEPVYFKSNRNRGYY